MGKLNPPLFMQINSAQNKIIATWFQKNQITCPICSASSLKGDKFDYDNNLCFMPKSDEFEKGYVVLLITCNKCYFVMPFGAKKMGLVS